jgi:hypothetical protein
LLETLHLEMEKTLARKGENIKCSYIDTYRNATNSIISASNCSVEVFVVSNMAENNITPTPNGSTQAVAALSITYTDKATGRSDNATNN